MLCGGAEIFLIDVDRTEEHKIWSWRGVDHLAELPANLHKSFQTTTDMRPMADGRSLAICSSSGGCAVIDKKSGRVSWSVKVVNAHAIEPLPAGRVVVAGSIPNNKLLVFDPAKGEQPLCETALPSAHGVVWDEKRHCLYALGYDELRVYTFPEKEDKSISFHLEKTVPLPDPDGHDLSAIPGSEDLIFSTNAGVWLIDRNTFAVRAHDLVKDRKYVKSLSIDPTSKRLAMIQAKDDREWWSGQVEFFHPEAKRACKGVTLYKARWMP